jgi:hypothetical protein
LTREIETTLGVLSPVFFRLPAGSARIDLEEDVHDAGVLADRAVTLGAHARVDEDLRDCVFGGVRLFALVGFGQIGDVVDGVIVGDVLQRVGHTLDEVFLFDHGHD